MELDFAKKYRHPAVVWYEKDLRAKMDGFEGHNVSKPPKTLKERLERIEENANRDFEKRSETFDKVSTDLIDKATVFSQKVDQKGKELIGKVKSKQWAQKVMSKFTKPKQSAPTMEEQADFSRISESPVEERKEESDPLPEEEAKN